MKSDVDKAKATLREELEQFDPERRVRISKAIAKFTAAAVRTDRERRKTSSQLVKLVDVFFNGRPA